VLPSAWLLATALALQSAAPAPAPERAKTAVVEPDRPIQRLFQNLATDLRRLPTIDSALIAGVGVGGAFGIHGQDRRLSRWAITQGSTGYTGIGNVLGDGWVQAGGAVATYALGLAAHSSSTTHIGSDLIRAQALNGLVTSGLKLAAHRERPSGGRHSLPSGHTSAAFASATVLQSHLGWKAGIPAYVAASFIGWTRVRDEHHWMSDVVIGASIGVVAGHTVTFGHRGERWALVPAKTGDTFAVFMVRR